MSRPSNYDPDLHPKIAKNLAERGFTLEDIANALGLSVRNLYRWKKDYPALGHAISQGKDTPDNEAVMALFKRVTGFVGPDGKYYPPDVPAIWHWLRNRRPEDWRDRKEVTMSGPIEIEVVYRNEQPEE